MGEKSEAKILKAIVDYRRIQGRFQLDDGIEISEGLIDYLESKISVHRIAAAGSVRRRRDTVGDIDILVTCEEPPKAISAFVQHPDASQVVASGDTKASIVLRRGQRVTATDSRQEAVKYTTPDPHLRLPEAEREYNFAGVFRIAPDGQITVATDGCEYPNGLAFSPDESVLYVAISRESQVCFEEQEKGLVCEHRKIRVFDVAADGTLSNNRVFASMASAEAGVPDGMKVDTLGRIFCTGSGGIWVFEPDGTHLGIIRGPEVPRNIAFGGPDFRTIYTTPGVSLYSFRVKTPGIRPY